jgi:hypothetical protein
MGEIRGEDCLASRKEIKDFMGRFPQLKSEKK